MCGVSEHDHESSIIKRPWHTGGCCTMVKLLLISVSWKHKFLSVIVQEKYVPFIFLSTYRAVKLLVNMLKDNIEKDIKNWYL